MTGGRSFAALKTDGNSLSSSTPKAQVPFALPTAGGVPAGGAEEMTAAAEESTATEEESTAAGRGEESTAAAEEESTADEGEGEESTADEGEGEESTATAAGRMPHLLYGLLPAGASKEIAGRFLLTRRRRRTSTSRSNAARKSAPNMGNATFALRNFQGYQTPPAFNRL